MKAPQENTQEPQKETVQRVQQESSTGGEATIADNRPIAAIQRKLKTVMDGTKTNEKPIQQKMPKGSSKFQKIATTMGKQYGVNMSNLKATHNSAFPAKVDAAATIQGNSIHFAPGMDTKDTIKHEVGHAIDNMLNGTPNGDKVVNGHKVDSTREQVVDNMVKNQNPITSTPLKTNSTKKVTNSPLQRLPMSILGQVKRLLRRGNFQFEDNQVQHTTVGNTSRIRIPEMRGRGVTIENFQIDVDGAITTLDMASSVRVTADRIHGNNIAFGNKQLRIDARNININGIVIKKVFNLGGGLLRAIGQYIPGLNIRTNVRENILDMIGANSTIHVGELDLVILEGSTSTRTGKGGYTGPAGQVQTQSNVQGSLTVRNLNVHLNQVPGRGHQSFNTTASVEFLEFDQRKTITVKNGQPLNRPERDHKKIKLENINATIGQNANDFNLESMGLNDNQGVITVYDLPYLHSARISQINSDLNPNGTGFIRATIKVKPKVISKVAKVTFRIDVPVNNWIVAKDDIINSVNTMLRRKRLSILSGKATRKINSMINEPGDVRRNLEVFDPNIVNTADDVVTTNLVAPYDPDRIVTGINLVKLFEYHVAAKKRRFMRR